MKLPLTVKKDKRNVFCGYLLFMDHLLIQHGKKVTDVEQAMKKTLLNMYEIAPDAIQFNVHAHHTIKAYQVINRLKRKQSYKRLEVSFDSDYFTTA
jgi:hypothetical protein